MFKVWVQINPDHLSAVGWADSMSGALAMIARTDPEGRDQRNIRFISATSGRRLKSTGARKAFDVFGRNSNDARSMADCLYS